MRRPSIVGGAGCQVRCAGCKVVLTVLAGLTEFACPTCKLPQMLPPELMPQGIDPTKIQLPCANCNALLNELSGKKKEFSASRKEALKALADMEDRAKRAEEIARASMAAEKNAVSELEKLSAATQQDRVELHNTKTALTKMEKEKSAAEEQLKEVEEFLRATNDELARLSSQGAAGPKRWRPWWPKQGETPRILGTFVPMRSVCGRSILQKARTSSRRWRRSSSNSSRRNLLSAIWLPGV